jgi:hypothetical protein
MTTQSGSGSRSRTCAAELEEILGEQDLVTLQRFGDYAGGAFEEKAPRLILCGRAV